MNINNFIEENKHLELTEWKLPEDGYIYFICEDDGLIIYIGTTMNIYARAKAHSSRVEFHNKCIFFTLISREECLELEKELILDIKPKFNTEWIKNKKYNTYKISKEEKAIRQKNAMLSASKRRKVLTDIMEKQNISQIKLAELMKVSRQRVFQIINGSNMPNKNTRKKLEKALNSKLNL